MRMLNKQELKPGLVIFQRSDVQHNDWYCRIKVPNVDKYKLCSLKTTDVNAAKSAAWKEEGKIQGKVEEGLPIFAKAFATVAAEYIAFQKQRADAHEITHKRRKVEEGYINTHLITYIGNTAITLVGEEKWTGYPLWRRSNGQGLRSADKRVSDWTIRGEMNTFRSVMLFAVKKKYVTADRVQGFSLRPLKLGKPRGEAFTPEEYKQLYTFSRYKWCPAAKDKRFRWYRDVFHNFMLCMTNTGLRPPEASNLRRRDVGELRNGSDGRQFVPINVRGKGKFRVLVAPINVNTYFGRIFELTDQRLKELGREPKPDDPVFMNYDGTPALTLYDSLLNSLLREADLLLSASGKRRSTYSFRHTYATFRLMRGTDVYILAKQMGTSVEMIEDYYGHITPVSNADRILQGIPGWELSEDVDGETVASVNAGAAGTKSAKPRTKRSGRRSRPAGQASRSTRRHLGTAKPPAQRR